MDILKEFDEWLGATSTFSVQYTRYIRSLINKLFKNKCVEIGNLFDTNAFKKAKMTDITRKFLILCQCITQEELNNIKTGSGAAVTKWKKKTIQDYQSGLNAFVEFIIEEGYVVDSKWKSVINTEIKKYNKTSFAISYSRREIVDIFMQRLITWDRVYSKIVYPARLINLIFNNSCKHDDYKELLKDTISNIKIIIDSSGNYTTLRKILSIEIGLNGFVKAFTSKGKYDVYTHDGKSYIKLKANNLMESLSIDHDDALAKILNGCVSSYPQLDCLSKTIAKHESSSASYNHVDYKAYLSGDKRIKEWTKSVFVDCNNTLTDPIFVCDLFNEFSDLYTNVLKFTIMQKNLNSSKGKKTIP